MTVIDDAITIGKWVGRFVAVFAAFKKFWETVAASDENNTDSTAEQSAAALELALAVKRQQAKEELGER